MDFGKVPENDLLTIDFSLPAEPLLNKDILTGKTEGQPKIYVGRPTWATKESIGKIYPNGIKSDRFLNEYTKHYNTVELNATHYNLYDAAAIKKWAAKVSDRHFLFCPKVYQGISHLGSLNDKQSLTDTFLAGVTAFEEHLGPVFLQLSEKFGPNRKEELFNYLGTLPTNVSFFLEVRHPGWFLPGNLSPLVTALKETKTGFIITDTAGRRDVCHLHLSTPKAFIRFVGEGHHTTDFTRIDAWVQRIDYWFKNGLTHLWFFLHLHNESLSHELAIYLVDKLNAVCGLNLKKPFLVQQPLF